MSNEFHDENNLYHFSYRDPNAESAAGSIVEPAADPVVTNTPAQPKKHHRGAGRVVALLLSCAVISAACGFGVIAHDAELFRNGRGVDGLFVRAAARESQGADNGNGNALSRNETREHKKMNSWVYGALAADL